MSIVIYQYWDNEVVPKDMSVLIERLKTQNSGMEHVLLNYASATNLICRLHGPRETLAFCSCGPPAMQADYLRLCLMSALGGFYIDADTVPNDTLQSLVDEVGEGLIPQWLVILTNSVYTFVIPEIPLSIIAYTSRRRTYWIDGSKALL